MLSTTSKLLFRQTKTTITYLDKQKLLYYFKKKKTTITCC